MKPNMYQLLLQAQALLPKVGEPQGLGIVVCILAWLKVWSDHWHARQSEGNPPTDRAVTMVANCTFASLLKANGATTAPAIEQAIAELVKLNPALENVLQPLHFSIVAQLDEAANAWPATLHNLVTIINQLSFEYSAPSFACATEFAAVIAAVCKESAPHVRAFAPLCGKLLQPQAGEVVLDPACGHGHLLLACASALAEESATATQLQVGLHLHGMAHDVREWSLTKMRLSLAGLPHGHIRHANPLLNPFADLPEAEKALALGGADIVVMAIPETNWPWCNALAFHQQDPRLQGHTSADSRLLPTWQALAALKPATGRMALIMPTHMQNISGGQALWQHLVEHNLLDAVISLTGRPGQVLLIIRSQRSRTDIAFIQVQGAGAIATAWALQAYQHYQAGQPDPCLVCLAQGTVATNHYQLNLQLYSKELAAFYGQTVNFVLPT